MHSATQPVLQSLSYTITGGAARLKSCRQKHGGFWPLLTPDPCHWSQITV